jgi:hypothetical protein
VWSGFWTLIWAAVVIAVIVGVIVAIFGGGGSKEVNVPPNAPGRAMLSSLEANGKIDDFKAVEPDDGWTYQYEINGDSDLYVQFRGSGPGTQMQVNFPESDQDVADAISAAARDQGYGISQ